MSLLKVLFEDFKGNIPKAIMASEKALSLVPSMFSEWL